MFETARKDRLPRGLARYVLYVRHGVASLRLKLLEVLEGPHVYNEMRLPAKFIEVLESKGQWRADVRLLRRVIPARDLYSPNLYEGDAIKRETNAWLVLATGEEPERIGKADARYSPGIVDPYQVILIGDVDPDLPIALDYRGTLDQPCVLYFNVDDCWVKAADSFEEFWARMNDSS